MMEQDYMEITGDVIQICGMLLEGTISLYEDHTSDLCELASQHGIQEVVLP